MTKGDHLLMRAQCESELPYARLSIDIRAIYDVLNVLSGFASNGTACGACQMSNDCARDAIKRLAQASGVTVEEARGRS